MSSKQNNRGKKPSFGGGKIKFNIYWIYALVLIVLTYIAFDGGGENSVSKEIKWDKLKKALVAKDFSRINVVNKEFAEVYIKNEAIKTKDEYKDLRVQKGLFSNGEKTDSKGFFIYRFVDYEDFRDQLRTVEGQWIAADTVGVESQVKKQEIISNLRINVESETRKSFFGENSFFLISMNPLKYSSIMKISF